MEEMLESQLNPEDSQVEEEHRLEISLLRHGQSLHNVAVPAYFAGGSKDYDLGLTESGKESSAELAAELNQGGKLDGLIYTGLLRSKETAEIIADNLGYPVELIEMAGLSEVDVGEFAGKTRDQIRQNGSDEAKAALDQFLADDITKINFPGGENYEAVCRRIKESLDQIVAEHGNKTRLAIVGHGNINRVMLTLLSPENIGLVEELTRNFPHNTIIEFDIVIDRNGHYDFDNVHVFIPDGEENELV